VTSVGEHRDRHGSRNSKRKEKGSLERKRKIVAEPFDAITKAIGYALRAESTI